MLNTSCEFCVRTALGCGVETPSFATVRMRGRRRGATTPSPVTRGWGQNAAPRGVEASPEAWGAGRRVRGDAPRRRPCSPGTSPCAAKPSRPRGGLTRCCRPAAGCSLHVSPRLPASSALTCMSVAGVKAAGQVLPVNRYPLRNLAQVIID